MPTNDPTGTDSLVGVSFAPIIPGYALVPPLPLSLMSHLSVVEPIDTTAAIPEAGPAVLPRVVIRPSMLVAETQLSFSSVMELPNFNPDAAEFLGDAVETPAEGAFGGLGIIGWDLSVGLSPVSTEHMPTTSLQNVSPYCNQYFKTMADSLPAKRNLLSAVNHTQIHISLAIDEIYASLVEYSLYEILSNHQLLSFVVL